MPTGADTPVVVDASVVVALLADVGENGAWASSQVTERRLAAPDHLHVEVSNSLRRLERHGRLSLGAAARAHARSLTLPVLLVPYALVSARAWALRSTLSSYDATYVALAERLEAPLLTLDGAIAKAPGVRCEVRSPT